MVMELYWLRKTKVLFAVYWAATAGNTRSSPIIGGKSFTQLAAVDQLVSVPPPSHVFTAACVAVDSVNRSKNRNARFIMPLKNIKLVLSTKLSQFVSHRDQLCASPPYFRVQR